MLEEQPSFTDVKPRLVINSKDDKEILMIEEADEKDEINTPMLPKLNKGLRKLSKNETATIDMTRSKSTIDINFTD